MSATEELNTKHRQQSWAWAYQEFVRPSVPKVYTSVFFRERQEKHMRNLQSKLQLLLSTIYVSFVFGISCVCFPLLRISFILSWFFRNVWKYKNEKMSRKEILRLTGHPRHAIWWDKEGHLRHVIWWGKQGHLMCVIWWSKQGHLMCAIRWSKQCNLTHAIWWGKQGHLKRAIWWSKQGNLRHAIWWSKQGHLRHAIWWG